MESNLSFLASRAISAPAADASPASAPTQTPAGPGDFAEVLNGQTLKAQRQHLATLDAPGQGLQVVPLGSKLNIITSDAPLPDMDSLAQFARMQGLDEGAVQALFGTSSEAKTATSGASGLAANALATTALASPSPATLAVLAGAAPNVGVLASADPAPNTVDGAVVLASAAAPALPGATLPVAAPVQASAAAVPDKARTFDAPTDASTTTLADLNALAAQANAVLVNAAGSTAAPIQVPVHLQVPVSPPVAATITMPLPHPALPAALGIQSIGASSGTTAPLVVSAATTAAQAAQADLMPMTAQAWIGNAGVAQVEANPLVQPLSPQDAVRLTLAMPAPEITKRLAQMSGTGKETTWAALLASGPVAKDLPGAVETVSVELPAGFDLDLLATTTDTNTPQPSDLSTQAGAAGALPASAAASTGSGHQGDAAQAQADQRAQQFQQLADKMGQAAAQRLIAQIERGQWKMQMRMQPAALGSVNVELDMHAGGLDALFSADNAVTRELMAQGSNKLRDTLTQAGMTVASVTVNGEQSRQSGGNSTPGKGRNPPTGARPVGGQASAAVAAPQGGPAAANDGLNVLA